MKDNMARQRDEHLGHYGNTGLRNGRAGVFNYNDGSYGQADDQNLFAYDQDPELAAHGTGDYNVHPPDGRLDAKILQENSHESQRQPARFGYDGTVCF